MNKRGLYLLGWIAALLCLSGQAGFSQVVVDSKTADFLRNFDHQKIKPAHIDTSYWSVSRELRFEMALHSVSKNWYQSDNRSSLRLNMYSLINANYGALFPELFTSDYQRAKSNAMRQAFQLLAMVISIALTPLVTDALGYGLTSIIYGILAVAVILYCTFGCHEITRTEDLQKPRLFSTLRDLLTNPKFWIFGLTNAFYSAAMSLVMSAVPFYVKYTLGLGSMANTILLGMVLLFAMAGVSVWAFFVKKRSVMPVWRIALAALTVSFLPLYFVSGLFPALAAACLLGFGYSGAITTMDLIGARIMDEDTRKNGLRREGTYASAMGFMNRLSGFFTSFAFLIVGRIYGFESGEIPGPRPHDAARFLMVVFPFCVMILSVLCSRFLKFPEDGGTSAAESPAVPGKETE